MNAEPSKKQGSTPDLHSKVKEWLSKEGYPIEFTVANDFRRHQFSVSQGYYVRDDDSDAEREVDVIADMTASSRNYFIRIAHIVECKWSQDKPWVVFTSRDAQISRAACVAQTFGSLLGSTILWAIAGDESLHDMDMFSTPDRPGFNGRQAFSSGKDRFYSAMKSVTTLSALWMRKYEDLKRPRGELPRAAFVAFPVIVVDGQLFEAYNDPNDNDIRLESVDRIRCHWRGAPSWQHHATIDIVTLNNLEAFAEKRAEETKGLLLKMEKTRSQISECFKTRSLDPLEVPSAARGIVGLPRLLREIIPEQKTLADGSQSPTS